MTFMAKLEIYKIETKKQRNEMVRLFCGMSWPAVVVTQANPMGSASSGHLSE